MSETQKYRHLTVKYCQGNGVDVASGGDPVVPHAIQIELPEVDYNRYNAGIQPGHPIQWRGTAFSLPFKDNTLDWIYNSHWLEDHPRSKWASIFTEWKRCLKPGGKLILLVPEVMRWTRAVQNGQPPNCSHAAPEPSVGDMSTVARMLKMTVIEERLTDCDPNDYSILGVFQK